MNNDSRPSILVVEDDSAIRSLLNTVLGERWTVVTANTADDALKSASATVPDLILLDVGLPDADGLDVCRKLKVDPALTDIPVIFLTSHTSPKDEIAGLEAGGLDYIPKPINPAILRARLNNHMELKRSRDALARLAHNDGLTGLINRRTFDAVYNREWKRLARTHQCLSVIMIDVDHFKKYNDTYGHAAGDECLRRVARAAEGALQRPADIVARYGGEEFIALLPDTTLEGAIAVGEGIRTAVAALEIPHSSSSTAPHVTLSLGAATAVPDMQKSPDILLKAADEQLYRAKTQGRNRTQGIAAEL